MSEFSGGAPKFGTVPAPLVRGLSFVSFEVVPVTEWQPDSIDKVGDVIAEQRHKGIDLTPLLLCGTIPEINAAVARAVWKTLATIRSAPNRALAVDQIAWASGLSLFENTNLSALARLHGLSKQAFQQGAEQYREVLPGMRSQSARTDEAREKMSLRNFRQSAYGNRTA